MDHAADDHLLATSLDRLAHELRNQLNVLHLAAQLDDDEDRDRAAALGVLTASIDLLVDVSRARAREDTVPIEVQLDELVVRAARKASRYAGRPVGAPDIPTGRSLSVLDPIGAERALGCLLALGAATLAQDRAGNDLHDDAGGDAQLVVTTAAGTAVSALVDLACAAWSIATGGDVERGDGVVSLRVPSPA